jgi:hypothetical protein
MEKDWEPIEKLEEEYEGVLDDIDKILKVAGKHSGAILRAEDAIEHKWKPIAQDLLRKIRAIQKVFDQKWGEGIGLKFELYRGFKKAGELQEVGGDVKAFGEYHKKRYEVERRFKIPELPEGTNPGKAEKEQSSQKPPESFKS